VPTFNNLKELEQFLNQQMASVLNNEVAEIVKDVEQRNIEDVVYQGYQTSNTGGQPWKYERRRTNGGLQDKENMQHQVITTGNGVELSVENVTKGKDDNFEIADLIEYGDGYNGKEYSFKNNRDGTAEQYLRARPFTRDTVDELKQNDEHVIAFKNGMKSRGIDLK
jgi:hypothetical protein